MMNSDITVTLKAAGELKNRPSTKSRKSGSEDAAFGQALADASASTADYRDNSVETAPKQEKQGSSKEVSETAAAAQGTDSTAVTPGALAEKMQTVQTGQLIQSILRGEEAPAEGLPEELASFSMETAMTEQGIGEVTEAISLAEIGVPIMADAAEATGQVEVLDGAKAVDALAGIQAEGVEMVQPEVAEVVAAAETETDSVLSADVMTQADTSVQAKGEVHKQESVKTEEDEFEIPKAKPEASMVERSDVNYVRQPVTEQISQPESHVTPSGEMREEYADLLKDMIARQISQGKQELEISLTPRSLGKLIVKVAMEAGETTVSIICTNEKAMNAMSQKAGELGRILEESLGTKLDVVVDAKQPDSYLQQDGRNANQEQAEQEQKSNQGQQKNQEADTADFLQQLRLGLA